MNDDSKSDIDDDAFLDFKSEYDPKLISFAKIEEPEEESDLEEIKSSEGKLKRRKYKVRNKHGYGSNENGKFKCPYCLVKYSTESSRWNHIKRFHKEKVEEFSVNQKIYKCPSEGCEEKYLKNGSLMKHALKCHDIVVPHTQRPTADKECPFCDKRSSSLAILVSHVETQHLLESENPVYKEFISKNKKSYVCQECGRVFPNSQGFTSHMRDSHPIVVSMDSTEKCNICEKSFKSKNVLKAHMKRHEQCESLCGECGKSFPNQIKLKDHISRFHRNKTVSCPICFEFFSNHGQLKRHTRTLHLNERNHACDKCEKRFPDKVRLIQHITAVHDKLKPYLCEQCPFECAKCSNLNIHRKKSHGSEDYMTKARLINLVKTGEHPYYNEEKFKLLLAGY